MRSATYRGNGDQVACWDFHARHGTAQLVGFATAETSGDHGQPDSPALKNMGPPRGPFQHACYAWLG